MELGVAPRNGKALLCAQMDTEDLRLLRELVQVLHRQGNV